MLGHSNSLILSLSKDEEFAPRRHLSPPGDLS